MKINPSALRAGLPTETVASRPASNAQPATSRGTTAAAQVELSPTARAWASLSDDGNDIDMVRVNAIRDAIAAGQLKIDTSRIADGLISSAQDLLK